MRVIESVREGLRDVGSGAAAPVRWTLAVAVAVGAPAAVGAAQQTADIRSAHAWVEQGAATWIEEAPGRIDGTMCTALSELPTVLAAGAMRRAEVDIRPAALPRSTIATYEASASFADVVAAAPGGPLDGVAISRSVAESLGTGTGSTFPGSAGPVQVGSVYAHPDDGRTPTLAHAALVATTDDGEPFDACWATVWPADRSALAGLTRTVGTPSASMAGLPAASEAAAGSATEQPRLTQWNSSLGRDRVPVGLVPATMLAGGAASAGLIVGAVAVQSRRLRLASDRHAGVSRSAQAVSEAVVALVPVLVGALVGAAMTVILTAGLEGGDAGPVRSQALRTITIGGAGALLGSLVRTLAIRERALFRYWKER